MRSAMLLLLTVVGCVGPGLETREGVISKFHGQVPFLEEGHRQTLGLTKKDIRRIDFTLDRDLVIQRASRELQGSVDEAGAIHERETVLLDGVLVPKGETGRASRVGDRSITIVFDDGLELTFSSRSNRGQPEDGEHPYVLTTVDGATFSNHTRYPVLKGEGAILLVDVNYVAEIVKVKERGKNLTKSHGA